MSHKKPEPIAPRPEPNICPVCGKASYSAAGIHPQCAVKRADDKRAEDLKREAKNKPEKASNSKVLTRWQKSCPKCNSSLHVRKKSCDCGHSFSES